MQLNFKSEFRLECCFADASPPCSTRQAKRKISDVDTRTAWGPITPQQAQPSKRQRPAGASPLKANGSQRSPRANTPAIRVNCHSSPIISRSRHPNRLSPGHYPSPASCAPDLPPDYHNYSCSQDTRATRAPASGQPAPYRRQPAYYHSHDPQQQLAVAIPPASNPIDHDCSNFSSPGSAATVPAHPQGPDPSSVTSYWPTPSRDAWAAPPRPSSAGLGDMPTQAEFEAAATSTHTYPAFYDLGFCPMPQEAPESLHTPDINPGDFLVPNPPFTTAPITPMPAASSTLPADAAGQWDCSGSAAELAAQAQKDPSTDPLPFLASIEEILDACPEADGLDQAFTMLQQPMQQEIPAFTTLDGQPLGYTEPVPTPKDFSMPPSSTAPEHADFDLADHIIQVPKLQLDDDIVDYMSEGDDFANFLRESFLESTDNDDNACDPSAYSTDPAEVPVEGQEPLDDHIPMPPSHDNPPANGQMQNAQPEQPMTQPTNTQATHAILPEQPVILQPKTQATPAALPEQTSHRRLQRPAGAWKTAPTYPYHHIGQTDPDNQEDDQAPRNMHQVRISAEHPDCCTYLCCWKALAAQFLRSNLPRFFTHGFKTCWVPRRILSSFNFQHFESGKV